LIIGAKSRARKEKRLAEINCFRENCSPILEARALAHARYRNEQKLRRKFG